MKLIMNPLSSRSLPPMAKDGITQISNVSGAAPGVSTIKIRWKVSYRLRGEVVGESGESSSVNVV